MRSIVVLVISLVFLSSCNLFKKNRSGSGYGGGSGSISDAGNWLNQQTAQPGNSCTGVTVDLPEGEVPIAPSYKNNWKDKWTKSLYKDLDRAPYNQILEDGVWRPETLEKLGCPNRDNLSLEDKKKFTVLFIANLTRFESGFDTSIPSGDGGHSHGILQLSGDTTRGGYGCQFSVPGDMAPRFSATESLRCGLLVVNKTFRRQRLCDGKIPCGGSSGKPTRGYFGPLEGSRHGGSKYRQFLSFMRLHTKKLLPACYGSKFKTSKETLSDTLGTKRENVLTQVFKKASPNEDYRTRLGQKADTSHCDVIANNQRSTKSTDSTQEATLIEREKAAVRI